MSEFEATTEQVAAAEEHFDFDSDKPTHISLTVRTLSGSEIQFPQLALVMTVVELKELIYEQNKSFPVSTQKLIKGAKTLENDGSLEDYGLKNGDTLHLVKKLEESTEDDAGPQVKIAKNQPGTDNLLTVVVPENARAGTRLLINPPGRSQMSVVVPRGLRPGQRFQVRIPPETGGASANSSSSSSSSPSPSSSNSASAGGTSGSIMQVQAPPNTRPGQQILIQVPGRGRMMVQIPAGVRPGQSFRFRVP